MYGPGCGVTQGIMARNIVVIGGGPAAVWAAIEAKKRDAGAAVTLVTDEACEPYEKPPCRSWLCPAANPDTHRSRRRRVAARRRGPIHLLHAIDRAAHEVITAVAGCPMKRW
jgi:NADPH-dependent 2,4-dienoyl-CoA reductase/sulfur reductase-like enzyme